MSTHDMSTIAPFPNFKSFDQMTTRNRNDASSSVAVLDQVKKVKKLVKQLQCALKGADLDFLQDEDLINLRKKFVYECERVLNEPLWCSNIYQLLWTNGFYNTLIVFRAAAKSSANGLTLSQAKELKNFCSKSEKYLLHIASLHPELKSTIWLNVGDLYRYVAEMVPNEFSFKRARQCYAHSLEAKTSDGHPFNQLGLLYREKSVWNATLMFLRSGLAESPYSKANANLQLLKDAQLGKLKAAALQYVKQMLEPFNRILLDQPKHTWMEELRNEIEDRHPNYSLVLDAFCLVSLGSMKAVHDDLGKEDKVRYIIQAIADDFKMLFKELEGIDVDKSKRDNKKRFEERRARRYAKRHQTDEEDSDVLNYSSDYDLSSDDDEPATVDISEEPCELDFSLPLLTLCIEWMGFVDRMLGSKRPSVAVRMTLQTLVQVCIDALNSSIDELSPFVGKETSKDVVWKIKMPCTEFLNGFFYELIPKLISPAESWSICPISFDKYYKLSNKGHDIQTMRQMAMLRLEHDEAEQKMELCDYYFIETSVFLERLFIVKAIVAANVSVLVSKNTLRQFDLNKKKEVVAAAYFLEEHIKAGSIQVLTSESSNSVDICKHFLQTLENPSTLGVLTMNKSDVSLDLPMRVQLADKFFERFSNRMRSH